MDQQKIGGFLKELRQEKKMTQEQLADFYDVDLNEIFRGERRSETMDAELKDTLLQASEYSENIRKIIVKRMHLLFIGGCIAFVFYLTVLFLEPEQTSDLFDFIKGMSLGISFGMVVVGTIMTSKYADRIVEWKVKHKIISE